MIIKLFFFLIYIFISKSNCLYNNEITEITLKMNQNLGLLDSNNYICLNFNDEIQKKNLSIGKVYEELLYSSNKYIFNFNELDIKDNNNLFFHFHPLDDCHIKISSNDTLVKIEEKSYYNNKLFYAQINSTKTLYSISYKIEPINYLNKDSDSTCHLIINSFSASNNNNIPKLNLKEKSPTFLHFDKNLKQIRLFYNLKQEEETIPIIFSFYIKDKVKFNVIYDETGLSKNISYIDKFIITKNFVENISILLTLKEEDKISDVIVRVIGDNSAFYYLQRNFLNLEFILSEEEAQYYYMEVYKNEEGEIMLHDKRKNGKLACKIFNQERFPNISDFIHDINEFDEFDKYSQKLSFNTTDCKNLNNKCYLLITYIDSCNLVNAIGSEYTILTRIWDKFEIIPQIINIPLNEYVFGNLEEKSVNRHYYTVFIPEDYEKISLEIHGYGINIYAINGKEKINSKNNDVHDLNYYNRTEIITLTKENFKLKTFKNQYISFSVFRNETKLNKIINYYFRVLHTDSKYNNIIIYPLDSNVENLCLSELILSNNSCYFLLKNDYNELSHNLIINELYDNAENYSYAIISKKEEDYYSINLKDKSFKNFYVNLDIDQFINEDDYVIIKIDAILNYNWHLTILSGFIDIEPSIQIYSYKLIYLIEPKKIIFNLDEKTKQFKLRIINNIPEKNKLEINFYKNNTPIANTNNDYGKQFSCLIEEFIKLEFSCKNESFIFLKFDYKRKRQNLVEINYYNYLLHILTFPTIFYIKDFNNNGLDFNIDSRSKIGNLDIYGYVVDFLDLEKLDEKRNKKSVDYHHLIKGIYDNVTQTGVIEFNKFDYSRIDYKDIYYVIEIYGDSSKIAQDSNIFVYSNPKDNSRYKIPMGKYIRGIFNSTKDKQQKYYTEPNKNMDNALTIIELSSNYKNVEISNENIKFKFKKESKDYVQIYVIEGLIENFIVKLNDNDNITTSNSHLIVNYIFKYNYSNYSFFNDTNYKTKINCEPKPKEVSQNKINIVIECNNNEENKNNINYSYALRLYQNTNKLEEELNTLAITSQDFFYFNECQTNNSNFNFTVNNIYAQKDYPAILFINYLYNDEKIYKVHQFLINVKINSNKKKIIIIIVVIIIAFAIVFIILTIFLIKMKKKNKELEDKVNNISFKIRDNDTEISDDEKYGKVSYI